MYLGAYLGLAPAAASVASAPPPQPTPVPSPIATSAPTYVNHVAVAISRLAEQFKTKS